MRLLHSVRRPGPFWATLTLLAAVSGAVILAGGPGRQDAARRVRVTGSRGVRVTDQVRVEPYGRAAVEHVYLDDDDDDLSAGTGLTEAVGSASRSSSPVVLPAAIIFSRSAATVRVALPSSDRGARSAEPLGIPPGRAPPLT